MDQITPQSVTSGDNPQHGVTPRKMYCQQVPPTAGAHPVVATFGMQLRQKVNEREKTSPGVTGTPSRREMTLLCGTA
jgi:hypothetical protein